MTSILLQTRNRALLWSAVLFVQRFIELDWNHIFRIRSDTKSGFWGSGSTFASWRTAARWWRSNTYLASTCSWLKCSTSGLTTTGSWGTSPFSFLPRSHYRKRILSQNTSSLLSHSEMYTAPFRAKGQPPADNYVIDNLSSSEWVRLSGG
jgi:hypothetical protein